MLLNGGYGGQLNGPKDSRLHSREEDTCQPAIIASKSSIQIEFQTHLQHLLVIKKMLTNWCLTPKMATGIL